MDAHLKLKTSAGEELFPLKSSRMTIGRGVVAQIRIADAMASREHCAVEWTGDRYILRDLASANGTLVNGAPVTDHALEPGDRIQIGDTVLVFESFRGARPPEEETAVDIDTAAVRKAESRTILLRPTDIDISGAAHASLAIEYLMLLREFSAALSLRSTVAEVCDALLKALMKGTRFGRAAVLLFEPGTPGAVAERHTRVARPGLAAKIVLDGADVGALARSNESSFHPRRRSEKGEYGSLLVPLRGREATYGALYVDDLQAGGTLVEPELHLMGWVGVQVGLAIEALRALRRLSHERDRLQDEISARVDLVGECPAIQRVMEQVRLAAAAETPVLIRGEAGTGRELAARAIHINSGRRWGPLEIVPCALLRGPEAELEIFGYEKDVVPGTVGRKKGKAEAASGGTLVLDGIDGLTTGLQEKLLHLVDTGQIRRAGGREEISVQVRLIAIARRSLLDPGASGVFRPDLAERLSSFDIAVPPLAERGEDVILLADHFRREFSIRMGRRIRGLTAEARALLRGRPWPGQIRELRNAVERAVLTCAGEELDVRDFQERPVTDRMNSV